MIRHSRLHSIAVHRLRSGRAATRLSALAAGVATLLVIGGCAPEVGSERWCNAMRDTPRGDWTANEAIDFTRHCLFETDEE